MFSPIPIPSSPNRRGYCCVIAGVAVYTVLSNTSNLLTVMGTMKSVTLERAATEDFFSLVGLEEISEEDKDQILESMTKTVYARVYGYIYAQLSPEEQRHLDALDPEHLIEFFIQCGFNVPEMLTEEAINYRVELAKMFELATTPILPQAQAA